MLKNKLNILTGIVLVIGLAMIGYSKYHSPSNPCYEATKAQNQAYKVDSLVNTETFEKYKVSEFNGELAHLDLDTSSKEARMFRTWINTKIDEVGINFAGHYSLVYVGMTGWGLNYFLVDRITGKGLSVPYQIRYLKTQKDSSLLVINPKDLIYSDIGGQSDTDCYGSTGNMHEYYTDLRPYYYNWDGTEFIQLGNQALLNPFWTEYFQ